MAWWAPGTEGGLGHWTWAGQQMWCRMPEPMVSKSCQGFALSSLVFILKQEEPMKCSQQEHVEGKGWEIGDYFRSRVALWKRWGKSGSREAGSNLDDGSLEEKKYKLKMERKGWTWDMQKEIPFLYRDSTWRHIFDSISLMAGETSSYKGTWLKGLNPSIITLRKVKDYLKLPSHILMTHAYV